MGGAKCGTTALMAYLMEHPEIFMPPAVIEPHFFGSDLSDTGQARNEQEYLSLFAGAKDEKRVGEKSALYLYSKQAASEIKEFLPSASIIIMLRNPVDMVHSLHSHLVYLLAENIVDLKDALDAEEDRKRGRHFSDAVSSQESWRFCYRDRGKYTGQVKRYLDTFGWENVHFIIFDDLISDTAGIYRDTLQFLGVDARFQPEFRRVNADRRARSKTLQSFLRNPPQPVKSVVKGTMPILWRRRVTATLDRLNSTYFARPPMDSEIRRKLQEDFLPDVEQLSELLGRDLTHWCQT